MTSEPTIVANQGDILRSIGCPCSSDLESSQKCACVPSAVLSVSGEKSRIIKSVNLMSCAKPVTVEHGLFGNLNLTSGINGIGVSTTRERRHSTLDINSNSTRLTRSYLRVTFNQCHFLVFCVIFFYNCNG